MRYKRIFDLLFSSIGLIVLSPILIILILISAYNTSSTGIFCQNRVGQFGRIFIIYKLRTIGEKSKRISLTGKFLRKSKFDELPQLWNILIGDMSFVGPRPDVIGYYDVITGDNRKILELKPGLTSEASLKYSDEEEILAKCENPLAYNDNVIFPDKLKMNLEYYYNQTLWLDIKIILKTIYRILF